MADVFVSTLKASLGWKWTADGGNPVDDQRVEQLHRFTTGFDIGEGEGAWDVINGSLSDAADVTYDLTALTREVFGDTLTTTFFTARALIILSDTTSVGNLTVGGAASDEWSAPFAADGDQLIITPGSPLLIGHVKCGWPVDNSNRNLKLAASDGAVTYSIAIIGTITVATGECSSA